MLVHLGLHRLVRRLVVRKVQCLLLLLCARALPCPLAGLLLLLLLARRLLVAGRRGRGLRGFLAPLPPVPQLLQVLQPLSLAQPPSPGSRIGSLLLVAAAPVVVVVGVDVKVVGALLAVAAPVLALPLAHLGLDAVHDLVGARLGLLPLLALLERPRRLGLRALLHRVFLALPMDAAKLVAELEAGAEVEALQLVLEGRAELLANLVQQLVDVQQLQRLLPDADEHQPELGIAHPLHRARVVLERVLAAARLPPAAGSGAGQPGVRRAAQRRRSGSGGERTSRSTFEIRLLSGLDLELEMPESKRLLHSTLPPSWKMVNSSSMIVRCWGR